MIPLLDLSAQYRQIGPDLESAVINVLRSGHYVLGEEVASFERDFAAYCGTRHAVAVNTGTSALHLALLAAGVGPGDEVITTPFTFAATAETIVLLGGKPVYVDIEADTCNIDASLIEAAVTPRGYRWQDTPSTCGSATGQEGTK